MAKYKPITSWQKRETMISDKGYVLVKVPEHPKSFCGGWYYEHRLVIEAELGRVLRSWETVHHISEDKTDNTWWNLFPCSRMEHDFATRPAS